MFSLRGRVALVTGSTSGIGLTLARGLGGAGAAVILNSHAADELSRARDLLTTEGQEVHSALFNVRDSAAVSREVDRIEKEIGPIDILVNNAGIQQRTPLEDFAVADWEDLVRVNMDGVFYTARAVARHTLARRRGAITISARSTVSWLAPQSRPTRPPRVR